MRERISDARLFTNNTLWIITSPMEAVEKYSDEYVCVCLSVCLSSRIFLEPHAIFTKFCVHVARYIIRPVFVDDIMLIL